MKTILASLLFGAAAALHAQIDLENGLVAHYPFAGTADDISGNNNHGTMVDVVPTTDRFGNPNGAFLFNGTTSHIMVPPSSTLNASDHELSISAWVRIDEYTGSPNSEAYIVEKADGSYGDWGLNYTDIDANPNVQSLRFSGYVTYGTGDGGGTTLLTGYWTTTQPQLGQWYHVVLTINANSSIRHYLDCQQESLLGTSGNWSFWPNDAAMFIGRSFLGTGHFNGAIDDVRIYDRALNAGEVCALFSDISTTVPESKAPFMSIHPNPTDGVLNIQGHMTLEKLTITGMLGQTTPLSISGHDIIDISHLPTGVYFLDIHHTGGTVTRHRVVRN